MYIIVGLGVVSSIASDARRADPARRRDLHSVGRNPLAGMAAAFAGVAGSSA
ncbi:MAG: hypothetical protein R2697_09685 [Ilumatobacteraceae bacterium]